MKSSTFTKIIYVAIVLTVGTTVVRRFTDPVSMDKPMLTAENGAYLTYDSKTGVGTFKPSSSTEPARVAVEVSKEKGIAPIITVTLTEPQANLKAGTAIKLEPPGSPVPGLYVVRNAPVLGVPFAWNVKQD